MRNQRITDWCKAELKRLNAAGIPDYLFPLIRAWADLRFMDGTIDPSDRAVPGCYRGDPAVANRGFGLGRACTLRSWLSMWSLETSKCQGPEQLAKFAIPALVIQSRADKGVFLSDAKKMFDAVGSKDKKVELMRATIISKTVRTYAIRRRRPSHTGSRRGLILYPRRVRPCGTDRQNPSLGDFA